MNPEFVQKHYGEKIDLGLCLVGPDLNVLMARGFAPLDKLAVISDSDVFDQTTNPAGTQRNLKKEHARDCLNYALSSTQTDPGEVPMVFPEILLNAREITVLELYDPHDKDQLVAFDSYSDALEFANKLIGVRVVLGAMRGRKRIRRHSSVALTEIIVFTGQTNSWRRRQMRGAMLTRSFQPFPSRC